MNVSVSRRNDLDLFRLALAAISVTAVWYALVFVTDFMRPRALPSFPPVWTVLVGLCPFIGAMFAILMLLMHRRGGRINVALFYGTLFASLTPWIFWAFL